MEVSRPKAIKVVIFMAFCEASLNKYLFEVFVVCSTSSIDCLKDRRCLYDP